MTTKFVDKNGDVKFILEDGDTRPREVDEVTTAVLEKLGVTVTKRQKEEIDEAIANVTAEEVDKIKTKHKKKQDRKLRTNGRTQDDKVFLEPA